MSTHLGHVMPQKAVIEDHDLLSDAQLGFRIQRSTVDVIFVLHFYSTK